MDKLHAVLLVGALCLSGCTNGDITTNSQELTADPCTAVTLTAPAAGFVAQVGSGIALSGSATCPAGVVPEFEYWTKAPGDANWNTTALGGYVPGGDSFTPSVAAGLCFSVAVRAAGSTDVYQAHSSGACGTVTTSPGSSTLGAGTFLQVAGGAFQMVGNITATQQLWVAQVDGLAIGQAVTSGSVAVQCMGTGGGFFIPCARTREVGGWQCGPVSACGTAASASVPFQVPFVEGDQSHLDIGIVASTPTFIATTAVLNVQ
jgi:hypothetical protein